MTRNVALTAGIAAILAIGIGSTAISGSHASKEIEAGIKARKAAMQLYAFNISALGAMAKGDVEYDAEAAKTAAANLAGVTRLNMMRAWVPGSDSDSLGDATRALPAIWQEGSKAGEYSGKLKDAAAQMEMVAGDGLDAMRGAMGALGGACKACHDDYRKPK